MTHKRLYRAFRDVLDLARIPHLGRGRGPRLHDPRHHTDAQSVRERDVGAVRGSLHKLFDKPRGYWVSRSESDEPRASIARWPPDKTHAFRHTGQPFKHRTRNGQELQPGDVVELNEGQAAALADRFEAVVEEPVST